MQISNAAQPGSSRSWEDKQIKATAKAKAKEHMERTVRSAASSFRLMSGPKITTQSATKGPDQQTEPEESFDVVQYESVVEVQ